MASVGRLPPCPPVPGTLVPPLSLQRWVSKQGAGLMLSASLLQSTEAVGCERPRSAGRGGAWDSLVALLSVLWGAGQVA